jgi:sugar lactone lactonase YvrE
MTSPDGITWTSRSAAEANNWSEVTYAKGTFVAVSNNGTNRAMTSTDGVTWTARSTPGSDDAWQSLTYGNGNFVSASYSNVMYSTDGTTWAIRPGGWNNFGGLAYGNGKFVAVALGNSPVVMTAGLTTPTTPDAPTSLATTIAKGSASVAFTKGADGGSTITNYEYQLNDSGPWTALSPADAYSPVTISGLTNGTSYTVKLRAVNALGSGTASTASSSFTPLQRLVTPAQAGTLSILAGTGSSGTPTPGPATSSALAGLNGLAVDPSGNVYIADSINNRVYKITSGGTLSTFAGTGAEVDWFSAPPAITPGPATSADLAGPSDVAVDASGNVYVAVTDSRQIVKITPEGTLSIVAGTGTWFDPFAFPPSEPVLTPGTATGVDLNRPRGVAVDAAGNLYIADTGYQQILKVTTGGTLSVVAGTGSYGAPTPGAATSSALGFPSGLAVDSSGNLYIADSGSRKILKVTSGGTLSIFAGTGSSGLPTPGPATSSKLGELSGIAVDSNGNVFIADQTNNVIERVTPDGALTVVAGTGYRGTPTPGPVADSELGSTTRVATDAAGNIYILDSSYYLLEKVSFTPVATTPAAPTSLVATAGVGSVSIAFSAGADGGAAITKYQYKVGNGSWTDAVGTTSPITVSGLTNYATVNIRLRAVNSAGAGAASTGVSVWPRIAGSSLTSVKAQGTTGIRASFAALTPVGGTTSHYWVYAYAKNTNTVVSSCRSTAAARGCLINGLSANTEYDVAVRGFFTLTGSPTVLPTTDSVRQTVRTRN